MSNLLCRTASGMVKITYTQLEKRILNQLSLIIDQHPKTPHLQKIATEVGDSIVNGFSPYHAVKEFSIKKLCLLKDNSLDEEFRNLLETEISEQAVNGMISADALMDLWRSERQPTDRIF